MNRKAVDAMQSQKIPFFIFFFKGTVAAPHLQSSREISPSPQVQTQKGNLSLEEAQSVFCQIEELPSSAGAGVADLSYLDGVLALREVDLLLLRLVQLGVGLSGRKTSSDSASLLGAEIQRQVLLVLVEQAELGALLEVDDGEDASDRLADVVAIGREKVST